MRSSEVGPRNFVATPTSPKGRPIGPSGPGQSLASGGAGMQERP